MTPDHDKAQYHLLPSDNAERIVDIMRQAAGLPPKHTGPEDEDD